MSSQEFVLVANTSESLPANVTFTFRDQFGNSWTHNAVVQPRRRYTVKVNNVVGVASQVSTTVDSDIPVVAERAMYLPPGSPVNWKTGHVTVGVGE